MVLVRTMEREAYVEEENHEEEDYDEYGFEVTGVVW